MEVHAKEQTWHANENFIRWLPVTLSMYPILSDTLQINCHTLYMSTVIRCKCQQSCITTVIHCKCQQHAMFMTTVKHYKCLVIAYCQIMYILTVIQCTRQLSYIIQLNCRTPFTPTVIMRINCYSLSYLLPYAIHVDFHKLCTLPLMHSIPQISCAIRFDWIAVHM